MLFGLVLIGVLARTLIAARGWFYWDDLTLQSQARSHTTPDLSLLLAGHDGHLMPAAWLMEWLLAQLTPLNWSAAVFTLAVLQLAAALAVAWACWVLCPATFRIRRLQLPWAAVPLGIYLLSPLTLPATTWLAVAVNALPMHTALAMMLGHAVLALRRPTQPGSSTPRHLVAGVLWLILGLLFNERVLFLGPLIILVLLCFALAHGQLHRRFRGIAQIAVILAVPTILWSVLYLAVIGDPRVTGSAPASLPAGASATLPDLLGHGYGLALLPTAAGGPWQWDRWHPGPPFADPQPPVILAGLLVILGLLVWTIRRRPRLLFAWLPVLLYPLLPIAALALARSGPDTAAEITQTLRHLSEVAVLAALTTAFLLNYRIQEYHAHPDPAPKNLTARSRRVLAIGALVAFIFSAVFSNLSYAKVWADQPSRSYFENLRAELAERGKPILDQAVPLEVLLPVVHPDNLLSRLLPGATATAVSDPVLVGRQGMLIDAALVTHRSTVPGTEPGCGARVSPGGTGLALDGPLLDRDWVLQFNYFAESAGTVRIALDGAAVEVPVSTGVNQVFVALTGGGTELHLQPAEGLGGFCVGESQVGLLATS